MKASGLLGALLMAFISAPAAEVSTTADSEVAQWPRIAERLRVEMGVTNFTEFTNHSLLRASIVHPSFGIRWDEVPPPTITGSTAMASVDAFIATNGWNMQTGSLGAFVFVEKRQRIRGLPWQAIRDREFQAVTHDGVLYVILKGWHHNYSGVAYNPKTNVFPRGIVGFKPLRDHWYVWAQPEDPVTLPQLYEGENLFSEEPLPDTLLDTNINFKLPAHWHLRRQFTNRAAVVLQLLIPDRDTDGTPDSSNAALTVEPMQEGMTVKTFGDLKLRSDPSFTVIADIPAGRAWRTVLSRGQQGKTPYVVLDRFGVASSYMVTVRVAFPIVPRKEWRWTGRTVADCNSLIKSLTIRGKNVITSELMDDDNVIWLRDFKDPPK